MGTSKGHRRVEPPSGNDLTKKRNKEQKGKGRGSPQGSARWRDTFQGRGWWDSRVSCHPFLPFSESGFSRPWRPYCDGFCYLLPSPDAPARDTPPSDRIGTWSPRYSPLSLFLGRTKARENTSVCRLSFISAFLEWHRCHRTHCPPFFRPVWNSFWILKKV